MEYIDVLKGLGMLMILIGHINFGKLLEIYMYSFHVPIFFFISGYLFLPEKYEFKEFVMRKIKTLLIPYFSFGFASYLFWLFIYGIPRGANLINTLTSVLWSNTRNNMPITGAIWFLTSIFFTEIINWLIIRKIDNIKFSMALFLICALGIIGISLPMYAIRLPFAIDVSLVGSVFFYVGYKIKNSNFLKNITNNKNYWILICVNIINIIMIFNNGKIALKSGNYSNPILFYINAFISIIIWFNWSVKICKNENNYKNIKRLLKYIGRNSIVFLSLQEICIFILSNLLKIASQYFSIPNLIASTITLLLSICMLYVASEFFSKTKYKFFIEKKTPVKQGEI